MNRKALIIGCPGSGKTKLSGVTADTIKYKSFFKTYFGGAWYSNEIEVIDNPNRADLLTKIQMISVQNFDYTIITFSGHGWESTKEGTKILLRDDEEMAVKELNTNADRQLRILDNCRMIEREEQYFSEDMFMARKADVTDEKGKYRRAYENLILKAEKGISILFACDTDETAGENVNGGYFTQALISIGLSLKDEINKYNDIKDIIPKAKQYIDDNFEDAFQTPMINNERRLKYFPWCLSRLS